MHYTSEGLNLWQLVSMDMLLLPSAVQRDCSQFEAKFNCLSIILPRAFCAMEHAFTSGLFPDHPLVFNRIEGVGRSLFGLEP